MRPRFTKGYFVKPIRHLGLKIAGFLVCLLIATVGHSQAMDIQALRELLGPRDAMVVSDPDHEIIFAHNQDALLVPASTLKILTALTALHYLGEDYRFKTEFYLDSEANLKIKAYGDPLLISEVIADICTSLYHRMETQAPVVTNIILDASYFDRSVVIPGVTDSSEPYDAPNGALCTNFNTVNFKTIQGGYSSAESQTPLLPMALGRIKKSGLSHGRITLSHQKDELVLYAGKLFKYFLEQAQIRVTGRVRIGRVASTDKLIMAYRSPFSLKQVIGKMMAFSNNFMANQILIETGISRSGPPGTLTKGVTAARNYVRTVHIPDGLQITEGSGISRKNRITADSLHRILLEFEPYKRLLRQDRDDFHKTGTLKGVSTRVGFLRSQSGSCHAYVILCNTPGRSSRVIRDRLRDLFDNRKP
jgi:serine-type D-Ala-D-Ala carboxypeptidase/endopeptidase (penicillin-binding protein 4)